MTIYVSFMSKLHISAYNIQKFSDDWPPLDTHGHPLLELPLAHTFVLTIQPSMFGHASNSIFQAFTAPPPPNGFPNKSPSINVTQCLFKNLKQHNNCSQCTFRLSSYLFCHLDSRLTCLNLNLNLKCNAITTAKIK